jgi:hypothetical protein
MAQRREPDRRVGRGHSFREAPVLYTAIAAALVIYIAWICVKMANHSPSGGIALIAAGIAIAVVLVVGLVSSRHAS